MAYRAPPHKDWGHGKHNQPQPSKGKTDLRTVNNSKKAVGKRSWRLRAQASEVEGLTPHFAVPVSFRCPQGTGLPTLPPRVLQGAAISGERISQGPPRNVVASGCPPPLRRVSERSAKTLPASLPLQDIVLTAQIHTKSRNQSQEAGSSSRIFDSVETSAKYISLGPADYTERVSNTGLACPGSWGYCPPRWPPSRFW